MLKEYPSHNYIISGDFYLPNADWKNMYTQSGVTYSETVVIVSLINLIIDEHFLEQLVSELTHIQGDVLDLIFTNHADFVYKIKISKPVLRSYTDHFFVGISTNLKNLKDRMSKKGETLHSSIFKQLNLHSNEAFWDDMRNVCYIHWEQIFADPNKDEMVEKLINVSYEISLKHVPK